MIKFWLSKVTSPSLGAPKMAGRKLQAEAVYVVDCEAVTRRKVLHLSKAASVMPLVPRVGTTTVPEARTIVLPV